jgi:hypothetical protein
MGLVAALGALACSASAAAEEPGRDPLPQLNYFRVQSENDSFTDTGDKFYTNGLHVESGFDADPKWAINALRKWFAAQQYMLSFTELMYTPTHVTAALYGNPPDYLAVLHQDRPYGAWLAGGAGAAYYLNRTLFPWARRLGSRLAINIQLGPVGTGAYGEATQAGVHRFLEIARNNPNDPPQPDGWHLYRISDTFGANVHAEGESEIVRALLRWDALDRSIGSGIGARSTGAFHFDAGNVFDQVGAGVSLQVGLIGSINRSQTPAPITPTYHVTSSGPSSPVMLRPTQTSAPTVAFPVELYVYAAVDGRLVAYNAFLDRSVCIDQASGTTCTDPYIHKRHDVGDFDWGIALRLGFVELAWAHVYRSSEVQGPSLADTPHQFGFYRATLLY